MEVVKLQNLEFPTKLCTSRENMTKFERNSSYFPISKNLKNCCTGDGGELITNENCGMWSGNLIDPCSHNTDYDNITIEDAEQTIQISLNCPSDESDEILNLDNVDTVTNRKSMNSKIHTELLKYKEELKEHKNVTKYLENKYLKLNFELNEMQEKHDNFIAERKVSTKKENLFYGVKNLGPDTDSN